MLKPAYRQGPSLYLPSNTASLAAWKPYTVSQPFTSSLTPALSHSLTPKLSHSLTQHRKPYTVSLAAHQLGSTWRGTRLARNLYTACASSRSWHRQGLARTLHTACASSTQHVQAPHSQCKLALSAHSMCKLHAACASLRSWHSRPQLPCPPRRRTRCAPDDVPRHAPAHAVDARSWSGNRGTYGELHDLHKHRCARGLMHHASAPHGTHAGKR